MEKQWIKQEEKDVFFSNHGWGIAYYEMIMKDGTTQHGMSIKDEDCEGSVSTYFDFTDENFYISDELNEKYDTDDVLLWREVEPEKEVPTTKSLLKAFKIFNECGLIKEDLQFDPEHFIETVVIPGWNVILENKFEIKNDACGGFINTELSNDSISTNKTY